MSILTITVGSLMVAMIFTAPPLVGKGSRDANQRRLQRSAHDARLPAAISYITACIRAAGEIHFVLSKRFLALGMGS